jgi:hypothetical protein
MSDQSVAGAVNLRNTTQEKNIHMPSPGVNVGQFLLLISKWLVQEDARPKVKACSLLLAGTGSSNPAGGVNVYLL